MPARRLRRRHLWYPVAALFSASAWAQSPRAVHYRATINTSDTRTLTLTTSAGQQLTMALDSDTVILAVVPFPLGDIKAGAYIGSAAMPRPDGTQRALEVHVFPESMRGTGEGHGPFDLEPRSTMTNGTVAEVAVGEAPGAATGAAPGAARGAAGRSLTVRYPDGVKTIVVRPDTPVVTFAPGSPALLVPGAHCIVFGNEESDGTLTATRILVGKDGLVPPM